MVSVNYQTFGTKGFQLRLRLYQDGETKYINVTKWLKGGILKRHWNSKKQSFTQSCPFAQENNDFIMQFRKKYDERALTWDGSLIGFIASFENEQAKSKPFAYFSEMVQHIIDDYKQKRHDDGSPKDSYECYVKLDLRIRDYCQYAHINYDKLMMADFNSDFVNAIFDWITIVKKGKGMVYISKMLHAVLARGEKEGCFDMSKVQTARWATKNKVSANKYRTLSEEQFEKLITLPVSQLPKGENSELYRDVCVFLGFTGQSPCDAISLRYDDIEVIGGVEHFVFKRRKISDVQVIDCQVPINDVMRKIMRRWKPVSRDGYVFPIRNKHKLATQKTRNGDIKHFISRCNFWLKKVAVILGCDFSLHLYTFRHTAITRYISKGIPVTYIANVMGTSVINCEQIYYNNRGDVKSRNMLLNAAKF